MVAQPNNSKGFSLIELMVVVAIIGLLAVVASPYTGTWITSSQVQTAKGNLVQAHARAKAAGLRGQIVQLAWDNSENNQGVFVCQYPNSIPSPNPDDCDAEYDTPCDLSNSCLAWQAKNAPGVSIAMDSHAAQTSVWFDSRGRSFDSRPGTTGNALTLDFNISKGDQRDCFPHRQDCEQE